MDYKKLPINRLIELARIGKKYEHKEKDIIFPCYDEDLIRLREASDALNETLGNIKKVKCTFTGFCSSLSDEDNSFCKRCGHNKNIDEPKDKNNATSFDSFMLCMPEANKEHFTNKLYAKMHKYFALKSKSNREAKDLENDIEILIRALEVV